MNESAPAQVVQPVVPVDPDLVCHKGEPLTKEEFKQMKDAFGWYGDAADPCIINMKP